MNEQEFNKKLLAYKLSDAPVEVKEKAIKKLRKKYKKTSHNKILKEIAEGQGDIYDIEV